MTQCVESASLLEHFRDLVERFAQAVRGYWGIKNQAHWVLDMGLREDASRVRKDHAPENLALVRHVALWGKDYLSLLLATLVCVCPGI